MQAAPPFLKSSSQRRSDPDGFSAQPAIVGVAGGVDERDLTAEQLSQLLVGHRGVHPWRSTTIVAPRLPTRSATRQPEAAASTHPR